MTEMTLGTAHEVMLGLRDTYPRQSREREALATVSRGLDALDKARALLLDVASAGIEHHTKSYVVIQLPLVVWDELETLAQEVPK